MGRIHWSRPAAERLLAVLRRAGGSATTAELQAATRSMAVHSEVASLRAYAWEVLGLPRAVDPVPALYVGTFEGRRVYEYSLCPALMFEGLGQAAQPDEPAAAGASAQVETPARGVSGRNGQRRQGSLFQWQPRFKD